MEGFVIPEQPLSLTSEFSPHIRLHTLHQADQVTMSVHTLRLHARGALGR
jgi:hypothetical protein